MAQLDWTDILDIGLPEIDEQHKRFIGLSNSLIQAMINGMGKDVLEETIEELIAYTKTHFADEETYMERIGYPKLAEHQEIHARLTEQVLDFKQRFMTGETISPNETLDFINGWIVHHIMKEDAQIGQFVKNN